LKPRAEADIHRGEINPEALGLLGMMTLKATTFAAVGEARRAIGAVRSAGAATDGVYSGSRALHATASATATNAKK
jgi:hypothetical protein